ncbi:Mur ligase family protein [Streptomyces sp. NBC_01601]|uniref:Mur ligase family protein n=1 Tax=Streptomyces sp. NBC_01601 TaxID=2975892 RepID=UPI003FCDE47E
MTNPRRSGLDALAALARSVLAAVPQATVIGLTGSAGKTSTKDLLAQVLPELGPTIATVRSFNGEIGMPLAMTHLDKQTRYLVLEMGARSVSHITHLTRIAPPAVGLVLNVGTAHVGEFGGREKIAQAKGELVEALPANGLAVLNADDPFVAAMASHTGARLLTFGVENDADVRAVDITVDASGRPSFTLVASNTTAPVNLSLHGMHHVSNALAAAAVAIGWAQGLRGQRPSWTPRAPAVRWARIRWCGHGGCGRAGRPCWRVPRRCRCGCRPWRR